MTAEGPKPRRPANRRFTSQRSGRMVRGTRLGVVCRSRQAAANLTRDSNLTFNTAAGSDHDGHVMLGPGLPRLTQRILSQFSAGLGRRRCQPECLTEGHPGCFQVAAPGPPGAGRRLHSGCPSVTIGTSAATVSPSRAPGPGRRGSATSHESPPLSFHNT